jgi:hypothetical protein
VFDVLADGEHYADWVVGARRIRAVDDDFPSPGSRLHHSVGIMPLVVRDQTLVLASKRPELLELEAHGAGFKANVRFQLTEEPDGTTVVMDEEGADTRSRAVVAFTSALVAGRNAETLWRLRQQVLNEQDEHRPMPSDTEDAPRLPRWLGDLTARVFGVLAAVRNAPPMQPTGVTRRGVAHLTDRGRLLASSRECGVIVRFSRVLGVPKPLPDLHGLAVRFVDAFGPHQHHDLLFLATPRGSASAIPLPLFGLVSSRYSSISQYRLGDIPVVFTADVRPGGLSSDELATLDDVEITIGARGGAPGQDTAPLAQIVLGEVVDGGALHFDPARNHGSVAPLGLLNTLREPAYAAARAVAASRAIKRA